VAWCLIELFRNPDLLERVRAEVLSVYETDPVTGERLINLEKMLVLPLLQAVYVESLRMHVSMNVTREAAEPMTLDGYVLEKGAILQAPTEISHYSEETWGAPGHPATEFWPERHIRHVETTDDTGNTRRIPQFTMAGRTNDLFPFGLSHLLLDYDMMLMSESIGGGIPVCPGRFFAKQEMMLAVALVVARFEVEFVGWINHDGTPSDRPAQNDAHWSGGASVPPDRDMSVRWKRLW